MRQLAEDSLELLVAALPPHLPRRFPALLSLPIWGSIIGQRKRGGCLWLLAYGHPCPACGKGASPLYHAVPQSATACPPMHRRRTTMVHKPPPCPTPQHAPLRRRHV